MIIRGTSRKSIYNAHLLYTPVIFPARDIEKLNGTVSEIVAVPAALLPIQV